MIILRSNDQKNFPKWKIGKDESLSLFSVFQPTLHINSHGNELPLNELETNIVPDKSRDWCPSLSSVYININYQPWWNYEARGTNEFINSHMNIVLGERPQYPFRDDLDRKESFPFLSQTLFIDFVYHGDCCCHSQSRLRDIFKSFSTQSSTFLFHFFSTLLYEEALCGSIWEDKHGRLIYRIMESFVIRLH